jgi:hypothetical protein
MRVARVEPVGDAAASPVEHDILRPTVHSPTTREGPVVDAQALEELVGAPSVERGAVR